MPKVGKTNQKKKKPVLQILARVRKEAEKANGRKESRKERGRKAIRKDQMPIILLRPRQDLRVQNTLLSSGRPGIMRSFWALLCRQDQTGRAHTFALKQKILSRMYIRLTGVWMHGNGSKSSFPSKCMPIQHSPSWT